MKKNICQSLYVRQIYGQRLSSVDQVNFISDSCHNKKQSSIGKDVKIFSQVCEIYKSPIRLYKDIKTCTKKLNSFLNDDSRDLKEISEIANCLGVVEMLLDILLRDVFCVEPVVGGGGESQSMIKCPDDHLKEAAFILDSCDLIGGDFLSFSHLRWNFKVVEALFSLLQCYSVSSAACKVLEKVLLGTDHPPIFLENINGFSNMLANLECEHTKHPLFHILSMFMSDSEFLASSNSTLQQHDHWLPSRSLVAVKANQKFLLGIPTFLERLSLAACCEPPDPSSEGVSGQNILFGLATFGPEFVELMQVHGGADILDPLMAMKLNSIKIFVADIFHIVSLLLLSTHRDEVQHRLADCGFFSSIYIPAQKLIWKSPSYSGLYDPISASECSAFLRLVHAVAENHVHRYYLLSLTEINQLKYLTKRRNLALPSQLREFDSDLAHVGDKGLLTMIVDELRRRREMSNVRFWITRAMEAFLRGEAHVAHQIFLLEKGVVEDMIEILLSDGPRNDMVMQGCFDFLSTIMRGNPEAFTRCERAIDCTANFIQLVRVVESNLVDSNMFIRCMVLTHHHMKQSGDQAWGKLSQSRLLDWYSTHSVLVELSSALIRLLRLNTLSQENVSCLNTTILILLLAEKNLPSYLMSLSKQQDGVFLLSNLRTLLQFWRTHYQLPSKSMDRTNLEQSTGMSFDQWRSFVDTLLNPDPSSASSIGHHLPPKFISIPRSQ